MPSNSIVIQINSDLNTSPGSRDDGYIGAVVTLSNANNTGVSFWMWEIVSAPPTSTATLSSTSAAVSTLTIDAVGTFIIGLTINNQLRTTVGVASPTVNVGFRIPGNQEQEEFSTLAGESPTDAGWSDALYHALLNLDASSSSSSFFTIVDNAIGTAGTVGLSIQNNTTATSPIPSQFAPGVEMISSVWDGTSASLTGKTKIILETINEGNPGIGGYGAQNELHFFADKDDGNGYVEQGLMSIGLPNYNGGALALTVGSCSVGIFGAPSIAAQISYGGYAIGANSGGIFVSGGAPIDLGTGGVNQIVPSANNTYKNGTTSALWSQVNSSFFYVPGGGALDTSAASAGTLHIGDANATGITMGHSGITTTINGSLTLGNITYASSTGAFSFNSSGAFTVVSGTSCSVSTSSGNINISGASAGAINFQNNSTTNLQIASGTTEVKSGALLTDASTTLGFYGASAVAKQTSAGNVSVTTAGSTNTVFYNTTFTGGSGSTAYTVGDIIRALKAYGLLTV